MHYSGSLAEEGQHLNNEKSRINETGEHVEEQVCPLPSQDSLILWRTFISSCYHHPNLMAHQDVNCLRELFQKLGSDVRCESANILVSLGLPEESTNYLRPSLPPNLMNPMFVFAFISEVELVAHLNIAIVKKYGFMDNMKASVLEMVNHVINFPEVLLTDTCVFIYDFLVKFGVVAENIDNVISATKIRRREGVVSASVLAPDPPQTITNSEPLVTKEVKNSKPASKKRKKPSAPVDEKSEKVVESVKAPVDPFDDVSSELLDEFEGDGEEEEDGEGDGDEDGDGDDNNTQSARRRRMHKPFECPVCHSKFVYKGNANYHIRRKHPGSEQIPVSRKRVPRTEDYVAPYTCPICSTGFVCKSNCRTHIKKFHPDSGVEPKAAEVKTKDNSENFYTQVNLSLETEDTTDSISNLLHLSDEDSTYLT